MKFLILIALIALAVAQPTFQSLDLAAGGRYLATGQFCAFDNVSNAIGCQATTWVQDAANDLYFQDIGTGGQYYYYPNAAYAVRSGFCFQILGYNSSVLRTTYAAAKQIGFENGRTYHGMGASTCGTPLSQYWKLNGNSRINGYTFQQLSPIAIPNFGNFCFNVNGQIDLNDYTAHFDNSIFGLPTACQSPNGPIPGGYCANFYFQAGGQCNFKLYFTQP